MSRRVIITGAAGFIGRQAILPLVRKGFDVHVFDRSPASPNWAHEFEGFAHEYHQVDLFDLAAVRKSFRAIAPTDLLHFAWHGDLADRWTSAKNETWADLTIDLVREFASVGGRRIVASGSCAEYDWAHEVQCEGVTPLQPSTPYGVAKVRCQRELSALALKSDLSYAWARVFFCFGPYEPKGRLVHDVTIALLRGESARCTNGLQERDYLHTEDIGRAFADILESDFNGEINIASGEAIPIRDIVSMIGKILGREELIECGALPERSGEPKRLIADTRRLSECIGFAPRFTLDEGIVSTVEWFRRQERMD